MEKIITTTIINRDAHGNVTIISSDTTIEKMDTPKIVAEHTLKKSDMQYGILMLGINSPLEPYLTAGSPVRIVYKNKEYTGTVHIKTKARIDGLSQLIKRHDEFEEGVTITITYDPEHYLFHVTV